MASAYVLQLINNLKTAVDQQADYQVYSPTQLGEAVRRITSIIDVYWEIKLMNYFDAMFTRVRVGGKHFKTVIYNVNSTSSLSPKQQELTAFVMKLKICIICFFFENFKRIKEHNSKAMYISFMMIQLHL